MLPAVQEYRLVQLSWDQQAPFIAQSALTATVQDSAYPAISVVKVKSLKDQSHDLLILRPDHSLALQSGNQVYPLHVFQDSATLAFSPRIVFTGDRPTDQSGGESLVVDIDGLIQRAGSIVGVRLTLGEVYDVSFDLLPRNALTNDALVALQFALPPHDFSSLRRRRLQRWLSEGMPCSLREELDCLWTALFELIGCGSTSFYGHQALSEEQVYQEAAYSSSHRRLADDAVLTSFRTPPLNLQLPNSPQGSSLAAQVLLALHILGQFLRTDATRSAELQYILRVVLRLSNYVAPGWVDYWSRLYPDVPEAWGELGGRLVLLQKATLTLAIRISYVRCLTSEPTRLHLSLFVR
jgi:anaphase-promoting complex subunit 1